MANPGEDVLLVSENYALTESNPGVGDEAVVYADTILSRNGSVFTEGTEVLLVSSDLAQGPGGVVTLGKLQGDKAVYKGDDVSMFIRVTNNTESTQSYTVDFTEDGSQFASDTQNIPGGDKATYDQIRSKSSTGCFTYQANDSNEHRVCWMQVRPGQLRAEPESVWLGGSDLSSTLKLEIEVPSSESNDQDLSVTFLEEGTGIATESQTVSPGNRYEFTTDVTKQDESAFDYTAEITNNNTGITVETQPVRVEWTDNSDAVFRLNDLEASDYIPVVGNSTTLSITAANEYDEPIDYTLGFFEQNTNFYTNTKTVQARETVEYSTSRSKSSPIQYEYQVKDGSETNTSNVITVTWLVVDVADFQADPEVLQPGDTTTLSLDVSNPTSEDQPVSVKIEEDSTDTLLNEGRTIAPGDTETFSTTVTENSEVQHSYQAFVTPDNSGLEAPTDTIQVKWTDAEFLVDTGSGLYEFSPTQVSGFSDWYDWYDFEAHHGNEIGAATSVQVLDDGSGSIAISITHHDGEDNFEKSDWEASTYFRVDHGGYYVKDDGDEGQDEYFSDQMNHFWDGTKTDGAVVDLPPGQDQRVTIDGDTSGIYFWNTGDAAGDSIRIVWNA